MSLSYDKVMYSVTNNTYILINPLNAELNPICHLLALLGGATIVVVSRLRVNTQLATCFGSGEPSAGQFLI